MHAPQKSPTSQKNPLQSKKLRGHGWITTMETVNVGEKTESETTPATNNQSSLSCEAASNCSDNPTVTSPADITMIQTSDSILSQKKVLKQALPLILLVLLNLVYQNTIYIILFIALGFVFDRINDFLMQQIILQDKRCVKYLVISVMYIIVVLFLSYPTIKHLWFCNLVNMPGWWRDNLSFWNVLFTIAMGDFITKMLTVGVKCIVAIPTSSVIPKEKLGGLLIIIEAVSQFTRSLIPGPEWVKYIIMTPTSPSLVLSCLLAALYIAIKTIGNPISEGSAPSSVCPICHEKYKEPVQISCGHVLCHDCCQMWFDRDPNCPVCTSASVHAIVMGMTQQMPKPSRITAKSSYWKTGSTEYLIQLF